MFAMLSPNLTAFDLARPEHDVYTRAKMLQNCKDLKNVHVRHLFPFYMIFYLANPFEVSWPVHWYVETFRSLKTH